jgi:hypothetical protein
MHTLQNPYIRTHTHTLTPTITKQYKKPPQYNLKQAQYKIYPNEYNNTQFGTEVKFILEQVTKNQRGSRCLALLFLQLGTRRGWVVSVTPRPIYPRERLGTHYIGGWVGLRVGRDRCGKSRLHRDSIPGPSSP